MSTIGRPAGCFGPIAPPRRMMMATYAVEAPPPAPCGYRYDDDALVHQPIPATTPRPMPSAEFLALSRLPDTNDVFFKVPVRGRFAVPLAVAADDSDNKTDQAASKKKLPEDDPSWTYDSSIDATLRKMEMNPAEPPSGEYLWTTQEGTMIMADRAELVTWMYELSQLHGVAPGTLHRAVSYVDRFLSAKKIADARDHSRLVGGAAVFVAAKYEDRKIGLGILNAEDVTWHVGGGCTRRQVLAAERNLVATLGYRLSGPTAYTFVDHFTRHDDDQETTGGAAVIRSLAHHLADMTLLDFRCVPFLPSAVTASAILVARRVVVDSESEGLLEMTGYTLEDLTDIIDAIYKMHELEGVWPGCAQMMVNCIHREQ